METGTVVTGMNAMALLLGVGIGLLAGYLAFPAIREAKVLREQLDRALKEHEDYKASVNTHFRKTADLVGQMTRSYAAVYDHLATGARTFGGGESAGPEVPFDPLPGTLAPPVIETKAEPAVPVAGAGADQEAADAVPETATAEAAGIPAGETPERTAAGEDAPAVADPREEDRSA